MCGRYYSTGDKKQIADAFRVEVPDELIIFPSFNVAPQTFQPVIRLNDAGEREIVLMKWGLVPFFAKNTKMAYSTINARAETIATIAAYREPFKKRRCLVPASGFYEWMKLDKKNKQPYAITVPGQDVIAFAGVWDSWQDPETGYFLETFSIITTFPNELMHPENGPAIHDRMPVIVEPKNYERWLAETDVANLPTDLLRPLPAELMKAWKVGKDVGNVRIDKPELLKEITGEPEPPQQAGLF
jgi:putative SOS response-associated peptidase YedK